LSAPQGNPFVPPGSTVARSYHGPRGDDLERLWPDRGTADPHTSIVHRAFRSVVMSESYTCVLGRAALRRGTYRFGCYPPLGTPEAARAVGADLWQFIQDFPVDPDRLATFVAAFDGPVCETETRFERLLWRQLQAMHDIDPVPWDPGVGRDPNRKGFSFSIAGRSFFIVGLHPASSRWARRIAWPTLVFNAHDQFAALRHSGAMDRMTQVMRTRDRRLQGEINPSLRYFDGPHPETVMYSGRLPEDGWTCPLHVRDGG
jgi:FPC/CPF motif-containing protein YcgG